MSISGASGFRAGAAGMLAVTLVSSSLAAQDVGDRVRVFVGGTTTIGEVAAAGDEGFELVSNGKRQSFAYGTIYRLEQSLGTRSLWKKGLVYGAGAGFGAGVLMGLLIGTTCEVLTLGVLSGDCAEHGFRVAVAAGATWGAVAGSVGMAVGAVMTRESWMAIPIRGRRLEVGPMIEPTGRRGGGGVDLGGRIGL